MERGSDRLSRAPRAPALGDRPASEPAHSPATGITRRGYLRSVAAGAGLGAAPAAAALLAACAPFGGPATTPATVSGQLQVWSTWGPGAGYKPDWDGFLALLAQRFKEKYPQAEAKIEFVRQNLLVEKFISTAAAGNPPDVTDMYASWTREFIDRGFLLDITSYVARTPDVALKQFVAAAHDQVQKGGKLYALPWQTDAVVLLFNQEHLLADGLPATTDVLDKWTWDDLLVAVRKLNRKDGNGVLQRTGFAFPWPHPQVQGFTAALLTNGVAVTDAQQTRATFNTAAGVEAIQFLRQVVQTSDYLNLAPGQGQPLQRGAASLFFAGQSQAVSAAQVPNLRFDLTLWPRGPHGKQFGSGATIHSQAVAAMTPRKDAAFAFLAHYLGKEMMAANAEMGQITVSRLDTYDSLQWQRVVAQVPAFRRIRQLHEKTVPILTAHGNQIIPELHTLLEQATAKGTTAPKDMLDLVEQMMNRYLSQKVYW